MVPRQKVHRVDGGWRGWLTNGPRSLTEFIKTGCFDAQC
jgi:hypothetical protein